MARFMVKASEYKNVCKAVNDRNLAELKKEIIEILKKQDEKDFKKAIDYLESQELYFTHLEKSISGKWIEKAGYSVGTVRIWKGKKYKKIAPGKWARVFDKEGRGTNIAIGKLIAKVQKIDNVEDLMAFVMQNKQRFVDENGVDLPVLDKLRAAVGVKNENLSGESSSYTYGVGENVSREKNKIFEGKEKITKEEADLHKVSRKFEQIPTTELKQRKAKLERWIENKTRSKRDSLNNAIFRESYQKELDAINAVLDKRNDKKETSKPAEKKTVDYSKMSEDELNDLNKKLRQVVREKDYGEADEEMEQINAISKQKAINAHKTRERHTLQHVEDIEQKKKMIADSKAVTEKELARKEKQAEKETNITKHNNLIDEIHDLQYKVAAFEQLAKEVEEEKPSEKKKSFKQEMNQLYDAQDKAWEGFESGSEIKSSPENSKKFYERVKKFVDENNIKLSKKHHDEIADGNGHSFNEALALAGAYGEDEKEKALAKNRENAEKYKGVVLDLSMIDEFKTEESEEEKLPESSKETPMPKPSTGVYAPSESTDLETKKAITENKSIGENEVQMPYSKELENEIKTLKNNVSDDPARQFMGHVYYDDGVLVATNGRRLKIVKVGKLDGIENGSYVDINISKDGINLKKREGMEDAMFPNYRGVIPDNLTQKVTLNNKVIKDKIKEMKKDGAIDRKLNLIQLEFKNGKVYLDDTEIGEAKDINLKYNGDDTNYVNVNAEYLSDALSGNTSTLMLSKDARKAMAISTESTSNIVMPMIQEGKVDYSKSRKAKAEETAKKDKLKSEYRQANQDFIDSIKERKGEKYKKVSDSAANDLENRMAGMDDDTLKLNYDRLNFNLDKVMDKKQFITENTNVDKKLKLDLNMAILYQTMAKNHPEVISKFANELEKRGISVKKSLFDDFIVDVFEADNEEEIEDAIKADETEYNDYSAEQPELFNSVEFAVREALNRRHNCIM